MRQSACLVFNLIMVDNDAVFFHCTPVGRASDSMMEPTKTIHFSWFGPELLVCCLVHWGSTSVVLLLRIFSKLLGALGSSSSGSLLNIGVLIFDSSWWLFWFMCLSLMMH